MNEKWSLLTGGLYLWVKTTQIIIVLDSVVFFKGCNIHRECMQEIKGSISCHIILKNE